MNQQVSKAPVEQGVVNRYRPELDGVRAFCIIFTIFNHTPLNIPYMNGSIGVDIFFALSGWLITTLLLDEQTGTGTVNLRSFYTRRFFRIVPLYVLTILAYALAVAVIASERQSFINASPYILSFNSEYRPASAGNIFGHAWTLGIEEKFYIIWPAFVALLGGRMWRALALAGLVYAGLILMADDVLTGLRGYVGLSFGTALAILARRPAVSNALRNPLAGIAALAIMAAAYIAAQIAHTHAWNIFFSLAGAVLVGNLWLNPSQRLSRILSIRPLAALGKLTYGIYLLHVLCINVTLKALAAANLSPGPVVVFLMCYAASIMAALVAHNTIEKPMIAIGRQLARKRRPDA